MNLRSRLSLVLLGSVLALAASGCGGGGGSQNEIVIGEYGSLTGNDATFGQSTKAGIDLALQDLMTSQNGMIGGLKVRVVVEDDQGRAEEAATVVQKLVNQDQVVAVLGEVASSRSLAGAPICQSAGVPMITPSSTNPRVTEVGDFIFRMCFLDDFQGEVMARFAWENLGLKRVAILKDTKSDYSIGLTEFFSKSFQALGGTIVAEQAYTAGDQDFRAQLTALKARNADAIFIPGYYTEAGLIARQARELGITQPLLGTDGWESEELLGIGGEALNGTYYSNHWALDAPDEKLQGFLSKYREKYGSDPDAIGGLAFDAANVLFTALGTLSQQDPEAFQALSAANAGSEGRTEACRKLRDLIAGTSGYRGVTGTITLDANRNASKPAVILEIKGGKKVYNTAIEPA